MMRRRKCTNLLPTYWLCTCVSVHLYWYTSVYFMNLRTEPHGHVVNYSSHFSTSTRNFVVPAQLKSWRLHSLQRFRPRLHELHLMKSMLSLYHSKRSEHVSSPSCMFSCFSYIFVPDEVCAKVIMPKYLLFKHVPMPRLITSLTLILSSFFRQDYNMEQNTMKIWKTRCFLLFSACLVKPSKMYTLFDSSLVAMLVSNISNLVHHRSEEEEEIANFVEARSFNNFYCGIKRAWFLVFVVGRNLQRVLWFFFKKLHVL